MRARGASGGQVLPYNLMRIIFPDALGLLYTDAACDQSLQSDSHTSQRESPSHQWKMKAANSAPKFQIRIPGFSLQSDMLIVLDPQRTVTRHSRSYLHGYSTESFNGKVWSSGPFESSRARDRQE